MDLFTSNQKGRICIHENTGQPCIVISAQWLLKQLHFNVLVPQHNHKGKLIFCNATYSEKEILLTDTFIE
jgi:hypothetical protein